MKSLKFIVLFMALAGFATAQDLASFEKRTTVKVLDNGLTVIVCERSQFAGAASVVSALLFAKITSA